MDKTLVLDSSLRRGFTSMPNAVLFAKNISLAAKCLYAALLAYAWQEHECFPGQERLASELGCSLSTVKRHLGELKETGLISWTQRGLNQTNIYYIHDPVKVLGDADRSKMTCPDRSKMSCQDRSKMTYKEDSVENACRGGGTRARGDTCTVGPQPAVVNAQAVLQHLSGRELPNRVIQKIEAYDDDQIRSALQVLQSYVKRKQITDVVGFFLTALDEGWDVGPPAGSVRGRGAANKSPRGRARDKPGRSFSELYF